MYRRPALAAASATWSGGGGRERGSVGTLRLSERPEHRPRGGSGLLVSGGAAYASARDAQMVFCAHRPGSSSAAETPVTQ
eukprot:scaffold14920_cov95-Isochrysis_galbana.AAC.2